MQNLRLWVRFVALVSILVFLSGCEEDEKKGEPATPRQDKFELQAKRVKKGPTVDGVADELWNKLPALELEAVHENEKTKVTLKACHDGRDFYLLAVWEDPDESNRHKPWVWDEKQSKYVTGPQREDRIAFEVPLSERFDPCMLGGTPYEADVWHWKADRSNPAGRVDEEWHRISTEPFKVGDQDAPMHPKAGRDGKTTLYMLRVKDEGKPSSISQKAPAQKTEALVPLYLPAEPDRGQADVRAKGVWKDGKWTVEFSRSLASSNPKEDKALEPGHRYPFAVAVFDKVSEERHQTTPEGTLVLEE